VLWLCVSAVTLVGYIFSGRATEIRYFEYTRVACDITCKRDNSFVTANVFEYNAVISIQNSYSH
jgi:hypothetical protein